MPGFPAHAGMDPRPSRRCPSAERLPRTRGDGPRSSARSPYRLAASPHTRGWTPLRDQAGGGVPGFPAHAGMDLGKDLAREPGRGLPRTRGDGPSSPAARFDTRRASPHTRGWTRAAPGSPAAHAGFPAHAGMDPAPCCGRGRRVRLPRTRGDGPVASRRLGGRSWASPHTRGWTLLSGAAAAGGDGFPAHAGMDLLRHRTAGMTTGLPRTRGDGPDCGVIWGWVIEASPHTRGWTPPEAEEPEPPEGFPAHAGMDPSGSVARTKRSWLPRTRGDGPGCCGSESLRRPASPHTRGWTRSSEGEAAREGGFPAHAGMDPRRRSGGRRGTGLPRTRGDGPVCPHR